MPLLYRAVRRSLHESEEAFLERFRTRLESMGHAVRWIRPARRSIDARAGRPVTFVYHLAFAAEDEAALARKVGRAVESGEAERGVLVCGSGIGMCMGANRFPGVRAAVIQDEYDAEMSRQHNDANVACFGARKIDADRAGELLGVFLKSEFEGGRHEARVKKLREISS